MRKTLTTVYACFMFVATSAQSYTYQAESFENEAWASAGSSSNTIVASTGSWMVAKNNIQNNSVSAQDGSYSLILATKTNALISPILDDGAGILKYYVSKPTGGGRTISVSTSIDKIQWSDNIEELSVPSEWTEREVVINDENVRYIRFQTSSNGGVYLDNISVTRAMKVGLEKDMYNTNTVVRKRYFDLLGKQAKSPKENSIYIQENVYEDGSIKRVKMLYK